MANPTEYSRDYSFSGFQANNPQTPLPGPKVDEELDNLGLSVNQTISGLKDIRRADGALRNGIVTAEAMAPGIITGLNPATEWQAGKQYFVNDTVFYQVAFYRCLESHVSNADFMVDLAASRWEKYADLAPIVTEAEIARDQAVAAKDTAVAAAGTATSAASAASADASTASGAATSAAASATSAAASYDLFDDRYLGEKTSLPTLDNDGNALVNGALVSLTGQVDPQNDGMYVRRSGTWQKMFASTNVLLNYARFSASDGNLTAGQTTFVISGGYIAGYADVYKNGLKLVNGVDVTITSGTQIVLASGVSGTDTLEFEGYRVLDSGMFADTGTAQAGVSTTTLMNPATTKAAAEFGTFTQAGTGASPRPIRDKLREIVNLLDFRQGGDPDETAAFQRAIAMFAARGVGGTIVLPAGRVTVSGTVTVNLSGGTGIDNLVGVNITGPGSGSCQVYWTGGNNDAMFNVTGVASGLGPVVDLVWGGFSVHTSIPGVGVFFYGDKAGHMQFYDVASYEMYRHYVLTDCLVVDFDRCRMTYGIRGLHAYRTSFTYPNAISFSNGCDVGVMNEWGLVIEGGSELNFFGGAIEGNGSNAGLTDRGGVKLIAPGPEGGVAANFFGTYFEYNGGVADVYLLANPTHSTAIGLFGPTFNRGPDGVNGQHSVRIDTDVGYGPVNVFGHAAFPSFGGYAPSASAKRIASYGAGPVDFNVTGLYKDVAERPDAPNEGVFAACAFNGTLASPTADSATNVASIVKNGTGDYTINFKRAGRAPYFMQPTFDNAYLATVFAESATSLRVRTFNVAAAVVDPTYCRFRIFC